MLSPKWAPKDPPHTPKDPPHTPKDPPHTSKDPPPGRKDPSSAQKRPSSAPKRPSSISTISRAFASSSSSISTPSSTQLGTDFVLEVRDDRRRISRSRTLSNSSTFSNLATAQVARFGIGFERSSRMFEAGESVHGHVLLTLSGPLVIRRVRVQLVGRAHLMQTRSDLDGASILVRNHRECFFEAKCTPFGSDLDYAFQMSDGNFILRPGDYEFHFSLALKPDSLPSVNAEHAFSIDYDCSAHVECGPHFERLITCSCPLKVTHFVSLGHLGNRLLPIHFSKTVRISDVLPANILIDVEDGFLDIDVGLNSGVVLNGLPLRVSGQVVNRTGLQVTSVTASIVQRVALRLPPSRSRGSSSSTSSSLSMSGYDEMDPHELAEVIVTSQDFGGITIGDHLTLDNEVLQLPADHVIIPTIRDPRRTFRCDYCVRIKVKFQTDKQLHMVSFDSPISVGHSASGSVPLSPTILSDDVF